MSRLKPISIKPKTKVNQGASNPLYKIYIILDQKNKGGEKILDSFSSKKKYRKNKIKVKNFSHNRGIINFYE